MAHLAADSAQGTLGLAINGQELGDPLAQHGQKLCLQPGVLLEPTVVARAGVGQDDGAGQLCQLLAAQLLHGLGDIARQVRQVPGQGVLPQDDGQCHLGHACQQRCSPGGGALWARGQVARLARARVAKPHGEQADQVGGVKLCGGQT